MSESVLGLVFDISADPTKANAAVGSFTSQASEKLAEFEHKIMSTMANALGVTEAFATGMTVAVGAVIGLGAAMFELANKSAEVGAKIFELHEKTGLSSASLSGLNAIAKLTGESVDSLGMALARASVNLEKGISDPGGQAGKVLAEVMGSAQGLTELGLKPMDERMQTVLHRIFELNDVGERNRALQALMGRGWMSNIETLKLLAEEGYGPAIEKAKQFGIFFDDPAAAKAKQFDIEWKQMILTFESVAKVVGQELIPVFSKLMLYVSAGTEYLKQYAPGVKAAFEAMILPMRASVDAFEAMIHPVTAAGNAIEAMIHPVTAAGNAIDLWKKRINAVALDTAGLSTSTKTFNEILDDQLKLVQKLAAEVAKPLEGELTDVAAGKASKRIAAELKAAEVTISMDEALIRHRADIEQISLEQRRERLIADEEKRYQAQKKANTESLAQVKDYENQIADIEAKHQAALQKIQFEGEKEQLSKRKEFNKELIGLIEASLREDIKRSDNDLKAAETQQQMQDEVARHLYDMQKISFADKQALLLADEANRYNAEVKANADRLLLDKTADDNLETIEAQHQERMLAIQYDGEKHRKEDEDFWYAQKIALAAEMAKAQEDFEKQEGKRATTNVQLILHSRKDAAAEQTKLDRLHHEQLQQQIRDYRDLGRVATEFFHGQSAGARALAAATTVAFDEITQAMLSNTVWEKKSLTEKAVLKAYWNAANALEFASEGRWGDAAKAAAAAVAFAALAAVPVVGAFVGASGGGGSGSSSGGTTVVSGQPAPFGPVAMAPGAVPAAPQNSNIVVMGPAAKEAAAAVAPVMAAQMAVSAPLPVQPAQPAPAAAPASGLTVMGPATMAAMAQAMANPIQAVPAPAAAPASGWPPVSPWSAPLPVTQEQPARGSAPLPVTALSAGKKYNIVIMGDREGGTELAGIIQNAQRYAGAPSLA